MTKKHLQFCIYYMQVGDPQVAYKMTYPRAAVKSLKASVSRLMARPDVAEWVNGTEERVHNRMMRKFYSEHYDKLKDQLLTINQKRTVLTKIIKGETKRVRYIKGKYGMDRVEEDLPVYAVLRAVDLDTRLENFYNYLTRSDTWRKAQNIYVNTPTLQQQVNILISQTNEKEENKDVVQADIESPHSGAPIAIGVGVNAQSLSPAACLPRPFRGPDNFGSGGDPARLSRAIRDAGSGVEYSRLTGNTSPHPGDLGVHSRRTGTPDKPPTASHLKGNKGTLAPSTPEPPTASPLEGDRGNKLTTAPVSSLTPKKIINKLTTVNKPILKHCQSINCEYAIFPSVKASSHPPGL